MNFEVFLDDDRLLGAIADQVPPAGGGPGHDDADAALLGRHLDDLVRRRLRLIAGALGAMALLWWPTDPWFLPDIPRVHTAFSSWRAVVSLLCVLQVLLLGLRRLGRAALPLAVAFFCIELGVVAAAMGYVGGPELPWIHFLYPAMIGAVIVPIDPARRLAVFLALGAALIGGFTLPFPAHARSPYFFTFVSFTVFASALSFVCGHVVFTRTCAGFLKSRALARTTRALRDLNAEMESRVAAQTRDLRQLATRLQGAKEEERARISRELHDELGQELSALAYTIAWSARRHAKDPASIGSDLTEMAGLVAHTTSLVRRLVTELRPRILDTLGLVPALEWLARRTEEHSELEVTLELRSDLPLDGAEARAAFADPVGITVFRTAQEALTNVLRHARARRAGMALALDAERLVLSVTDDGIGFVSGGHHDGSGILGMQERARSLGGTLAVDSAAGRGTRVTLSIPLAHARGGAAGAAP